MNQLGNRVKKLRKKKGWTQAELGRKLGESAMNIANIETGRVDNPRYLSKLVIVLGTSVSYLLDGIEPNKIKVEVPTYLASLTEEIIYDSLKDYWIVETDKENKLFLTDDANQVGKIKRVFN
jgi:transcriptional regulator with XRE-family HTH domain